MGNGRTVSPALIITAVISVFGLGLAATTMVILAGRGAGEVTAFLSGWGTMVLVGLFALAKVDVLNQKQDVQQDHLETIKEQTNGNMKKLMDRVTELEDGRLRNLERIKQLEKIIERRNPQ